MLISAEPPIKLCSFIMTALILTHRLASNIMPVHVPQVGLVPEWMNSSRAIHNLAVASPMSLMVVDSLPGRMMTSAMQHKKEQVTKHFKSILQLWHKICFKGGIGKAERVLLGFHNVGGLWPVSGSWGT